MCSEIGKFKPQRKNTKKAEQRGWLWHTYRCGVHRKRKWKKPSELAEGCHDADQSFWISEMLNERLPATKQDMLAILLEFELSEDEKFELQLHFGPARTTAPQPVCRSDGKAALVTSPTQQASTN
jgi:hypothetical protein